MGNDSSKHKAEQGSSNVRSQSGARLDSASAVPVPLPAPAPPPPPRFSPDALCEQDTLLASDPSYLPALLQRIPHERSHVPSWRPSYRSDRDGKSFARFAAKVCERGPVIMIIEDDQGGLFGAYSGVPLRNADARHKEFQSTQAAASRAARLGKEAPEPITAPPALPRDKLFFGDSTAFLFRLRKAPTAPDTPAEGDAPETWGSAGHDANFVWFETSVFPEDQRGVGFGGRAELWALFLDRYFTMGSAYGHPISLTFNAPIIASSSRFKISRVEAWVCYEKSADEPDAPVSDKQGVLHKLEENPDRMILEMQGHRFYSEET